VKRFFSRFRDSILRNPQSAVGLGIVLFFFLLALFGEQIAPYPNANDINNPPQHHPTLQPTSLKLGDYPFGTDRSGRDVFSRVILGAESIFRIAGLGTLIAVTIGAALGLLMGYRGGWVDQLLGRIIDAMLAIPAMLLALVTVGVIRSLDFDPGTWQFRMADNAVILVIAVLYAPIVARVVRSSTLEIRNRAFVEAAQLRGESIFYIIFREILPSVIPALVVEGALRFSYAIFLVASLGFLGFGARPPSPDWGLQVSQSWGGAYKLTPWALEYPAAAIALLVIGVNLLSDGVRRIVQKSE
jgi:peptide/nickel transport system permease protein